MKFKGGVLPPSKTSPMSRKRPPVQTLTSEYSDLIPHPNKTNAVQMDSWQTFMLEFDEGGQNKLKRRTEASRLGNAPGSPFQYEPLHILGPQADQKILLCLSARSRSFVLARPDTKHEELVQMWKKGNRFDEDGKPWKKPTVIPVHVEPDLGVGSGPRLYGRLLLVRADPDTEVLNQDDKQRQWDSNMIYNRDYESYSRLNAKEKPFPLDSRHDSKVSFYLMIVDKTKERPRVPAARITLG